jgi:hypothetical protein
MSSLVPMDEYEKVEAALSEARKLLATRVEASRLDEANTRIAELEATGREVAEMVNEIIAQVPEAHSIIRKHALKATTLNLKR